MAAESDMVLHPDSGSLPPVLPEGEGWTSRLVRAVTRWPATVFLLVVGALWLVPAFGLLISSFRTGAANATSGWWTALAHPSELTIANYQALLANSGMVRAFINTVLITLPTSLLVVTIAALAAYAFAWLRFPGRDALFLLVVGLLVVPIQVALIPVADLYGRVGLFGTVPGVILFHVAFGLPFAIFLFEELLHRDTSRPAGGGSDGRGRRAAHFPQSHHSSGDAGNRLAADLPVRLGLERPAGAHWSSPVRNRRP